MTGYQNFLAAMIAVLQIAMVSLICDDGDVTLIVLGLTILFLFFMLVTTMVCVIWLVIADTLYTLITL